MSKKVCPKCGSELGPKKNGVYTCPNCKGVFTPESLIGIHPK
jgi:transposase